jgi:hypothetical protein
MHNYGNSKRRACAARIAGEPKLARMAIQAGRGAAVASIAQPRK